MYDSVALIISRVLWNHPRRVSNAVHPAPPLLTSSPRAVSSKSPTLGACTGGIVQYQPCVSLRHSAWCPQAPSRCGRCRNSISFWTICPCVCGPHSVFLFLCGGAEAFSTGAERLPTEQIRVLPGLPLQQARGRVSSCPSYQPTPRGRLSRHVWFHRLGPDWQESRRCSDGTRSGRRASFCPGGELCLQYSHFTVKIIFIYKV